MSWWRDPIDTETACSVSLEDMLEDYRKYREEGRRRLLSEGPVVLVNGSQFKQMLAANMCDSSGRILWENWPTLGT